MNKPDIEEVTDALVSVLTQACSGEALLSTDGMKCYADAVRVLVRLGRAEVVKEHGRAMVFQWRETT